MRRLNETREVKKGMSVMTKLCNLLKSEDIPSEEEKELEGDEEDSESGYRGESEKREEGEIQIVPLYPSPEDDPEDEENDDEKWEEHEPDFWNRHLFWRNHPKLSAVTREILEFLKIILIAFGGIIIICWLIFGEVWREKDGEFHRNLKYYTWLLDDEPDGQFFAFTPKQPWLIKSDLKLAQEKGLTIVYKYDDTEIKIYFTKQGEARLNVYTPEGSIYDTYGVIDFSIYNANEKDGIVIYGSEVDMPNSFGKQVICKEYVDYFDTLTYDKNVPFDKDYSNVEIKTIEDVNKYHYKSIFAIKAGDYSYLLELNENSKDKKFGMCRVLWYKDGLLKNVSVFDGTVKEIDHRTGVLVTETNELYTTFVDFSNPEKPDIIFSKVGEIDYLVKNSDYYYSEYWQLNTENDIKLPVVVKDSKYYTLMPESWETYSAYASGSYKILESQVKDPNYKVRLAELEPRFSFAEFDIPSTTYDWYTEINFDIGGVLANTDYELNGFDRQISLSEEEISHLSKKVHSIEEFWEHIQKIRETFAKYYDTPESF